MQALAALPALAGGGAAAAGTAGAVGAATSAFSMGSLFSAGLTGLGAVSSVFGAIQQSNAMKYQAQQQQLQGRIEQVKAEEQANTVRRNLMSNLATANAMFGARGLSSSGTPEQAMIQSQNNAVRDIQTVMFGGQVASTQANAQAKQLKLSASSAVTGGFTNAAVTLGSSDSIKTLLSGIK